MFESRITYLNTVYIYIYMYIYIFKFRFRWRKANKGATYISKPTRIVNIKIAHVEISILLKYYPVCCPTIFHHTWVFIIHPPCSNTIHPDNLCSSIALQGSCSSIIGPWCSYKLIQIWSSLSLQKNRYSCNTNFKNMEHRNGFINNQDKSYVMKTNISPDF